MRFSCPAAEARPARFRRGAMVVALVLHVFAVWVLTQLDAVRSAVREIAPVMVMVLGPQPTPRPPSPSVLPTPRTALPLPQTVRVVPPEVPVQITSSAPMAEPLVPAPVVVVAAAPALAITAAPLQAAPQPPLPSPARKQVPSTSVRYLVEPPFEVPRASRRAGEHGTVVLRVVISAQGLPVQVSVHRSSGYARLDEQAVSAMRQARFVPYTEDGRAIEVEALAPVEYPAEQG